MLSPIHISPDRASGKNSLNRVWVKGRSEAPLEACEGKDKNEKKLAGIGIDNWFTDSGV